MDALSTDAERYLLELCRRTEGNCSVQVSMFDIGAAIGLEKEAARKLAEDLIADGLVEIKTLSGGIGITAQGLEAAGPVAGFGPAADLNLGKGPILEDKGRQALETVLADIKAGLAANAGSYPRLEETVIDIKTIDVQMLSPRPKTAVIKEVLRSLQASVKQAGGSELAARLDKMIG